ncbi:MAG: TonB-dependent receptor [Bacteroidales bacterium]|nr:TonB-dependent receptor [Bacteroidales bacterium]
MNNIKSLLFACFFSVFLLVAGSVSAQIASVTVTGTVKDTNGEPVVGAAVMVDGSTQGVITDLDGHYSITFSPKTGTRAALVFSSIGHKTRKVDVARGGRYDVVLEDDFEMLDEVVVVGYGFMRKSDLTGSVTSVKVDDTKAVQSASIDQILQGNAAGVQVVSNSAAPDAGVSITIRGASSFNTRSQPLYVVDGIIINTEGSMSVGSHQGSDSGIDEENNGLLGISPQDIDHMEILKDASATAIYGSQGANGVILITTKSAKREKPAITFSSGVSFSSIYKKYDLLDVDDYKTFLDMKGVPHTDTNYDIYESGIAVGDYEAVDWQDYATRIGVTQRYYFTVAGNPESTNYRFSLGYNDNQGIIKGTGFQNLTARINLDKTINGFSFGTKTSFSFLASQMTQGAGGTIQQTPTTSMVMSMLLTRPVRYLLAYDTEGLEIDDEGAPLSGPDRWLSDYQSERTELRITPSVYGEYAITPWLTFRSTFGADYRANERSKFKSYRINTQATGSAGAVAHVDRVNWNWDNLLMVNKQFGKHSVSGTIGQSASSVKSFNQTVEGTNVPQWKAMAASLNSAPYDWLTYTENSSQLLSFFGRATYNYDDRYVLTATYRFDGSSKFAGANKWGRFPSFAFAWRVSNEPWFNLPAVSSAKIRMGWGRVGNQNIPSYQTIYRYNTNILATHDKPTHTNITVSSLNLPSWDLKWETTAQYNLGVDIGLFGGRLSLSGDAYYKVTDDLLQTKILPGSSGVYNPYVNMGSIENKGLELTANAVTVKTRDVEWIVSGNISWNRNKILSIDPSGLNTAERYLYKDEPARMIEFFTGNTLSGDAYCKDYINIFVKGEPMCLFYAMPTDGLVQAGQTGVPFSDGKERGEGSVNFVDTNGDGVITEADRVVVGNPNPDFTFGFNTSFTYKLFTMTAFFSGSWGNDIYNQQRAVMSDVSTISQNRLRDAVFDSWSPERPDAWYPALSAFTITDVGWCTDRWVEDGSYLRLANLSLSLSLPIRNRRSAVKYVSLGVSGKNLYVWTKYSGYDPDVNIYGTVLKYGVDMGAYPSARTYMCDLKISF